MPTKNPLRIRVYILLWNNVFISENLRYNGVVMGKALTVEDVVKGRADLTEVRFRIIVAMLQIDAELVKLVRAYLEKISA